MFKAGNSKTLTRSCWSHKTVLIDITENMSKNEICPLFLELLPLKSLPQRSRVVSIWKWTECVELSYMICRCLHLWNSREQLCIFSFAQWQYHNQWGFTEMWLLLVENFNQYPAAKKWNTLLRWQFLTALNRAVTLEIRIRVQIGL